MPEYVVIAVRHSTRRNQQRCPRYWVLESEEEDPRTFLSPISTNWFCRDMPKRIRDMLETADVDPDGWAEKKGRFLLTLKHVPDRHDFGQVEFDNVISITPIETKTKVV